MSIYMNEWTMRTRVYRSYGLSATMERIGFELGRLTTATPARLASGSIDWTDLQVQHGEDPALPFCHMHDTIDNDIIDKQVQTAARFLSLCF